MLTGLGLSRCRVCSVTLRHLHKPLAKRITVAVTKEAIITGSTDSNRQSCGNRTSGTIHERHTRDASMRIFENINTNTRYAGSGSQQVHSIQRPRG